MSECCYHRGNRVSRKLATHKKSFEFFFLQRNLKRTITNPSESRACYFHFIFLDRMREKFSPLQVVSFIFALVAEARLMVQLIAMSSLERNKIGVCRVIHSCG